jgi:HD superfamily phosphohydrolase YqeK
VIVSEIVRQQSTSVARAAAGELPEWSVAGTERREHIARVAALMDEWSELLGLPPEERDRWRAAAWLHDALREAPADDLRHHVPPMMRDLPGPLLHGPATAARLRAEGCTDESLLNAVAYHTLGHAKLDRVGHALYLADFLEPGRSFSPTWRASLRARMPQGMEEVLVETVRSRIEHLLRQGATVRPETLSFWNSIARG